jgi:hypothetical protein
MACDNFAIHGCIQSVENPYSSFNHHYSRCDSMYLYPAIAMGIAAIHVHAAATARIRM